MLEREREWSTRAGAAAVAGAIAALIGFFLLQASLGGDTNFDGLREAHEESASIWLSGIATSIGYILLTAPLLLLFRAAQGRSERVRNQFVGLVVLGPVLLGIAGFGLAAGTQQAADNYLDGKADLTLTPMEARSECRADLTDQGAKAFAEDFKPANGESAMAACRSQKQKEDRASNAIKDSSIVTFSRFAGFAGGLSLVVALFYTCLWGMRTGLLTRFWGSLGMAVGIAALIGLTPLALLWFLYLGLLLLGRVPGGRPPAWEAGEAVPWPTAGEKAAAELESPADQLGEPAAEAERADGPRKRKQRD